MLKDFFQGFFNSSLTPRLLFKAKPPDLKKFIGKTVKIDGKNIKIDKIVGNKAKTCFYEINDEHLIGMLRFHAQMNKDDSITEQQFLDFENMEVTSQQMPTDGAKGEVKADERH